MKKVNPYNLRSQAKLNPFEDLDKFDVLHVLVDNWPELSERNSINPSMFS